MASKSGDSRAPVVSLVDDDQSMSFALQGILQSSGWKVECHLSGEAFLEAFDPSVPGCILLDVRMPRANGFSIFSRLAAREIRTPIIFMTGYPDTRIAVRAIRSGAVAFLEKPLEADEVLEAVERAVALDVEIRRESADRAEIRARIARLTPREREVFSLVLSGRLNKQIASDLGISQRTVEVHRYRMMKKMQGGSVVELVGLAYRAGEESLPELFKRRAERAPAQHRIPTTIPSPRVPGTASPGIK